MSTPATDSNSECRSAERMASVRESERAADCGAGWPSNQSHSLIHRTLNLDKPAAKVPAAVLLLMMWVALTAMGQNSVQWSTNYYPVTGATVPEIRQSINEARPWKDRQGTDGMTTWRVNWRFTVNSSANGCYCNTFTTITTIAITLPKWTAPTNAPEPVKAIWTRYIAALGQHEAGHAQIGLGAAAELQRKSREFGTMADCESLKARINITCVQVVQDFRRQDKEYDERTRHGTTEGAFLHGEGQRRNRPPRRAID